MIPKQLLRDGVARLEAAYDVVTTEQQDVSILPKGRSSQAVVQGSITGGLNGSVQHFLKVSEIVVYKADFTRWRQFKQNKALFRF
jgi:hypothetical protein